MQSVSKLKNVNQHTSCPTSPEDAFTIRHVRWRNVFINAGAAPLVLRTISCPCPPAQPSPLCRLLFLQQCPLHEPAYQLSGLPPDASSHSEPGPPVSWRTNARRKNMSRRPWKQTFAIKWDHFYFYISMNSSEVDVEYKQLSFYRSLNLMCNQHQPLPVINQTSLQTFHQPTHVGDGYCTSHQCAWTAVNGAIWPHQTPKKEFSWNVVFTTEK